MKLALVLSAHYHLKEEKQQQKQQFSEKKKRQSFLCFLNNLQVSNENITWKKFRNILQNE